MNIVVKTEMTKLPQDCDTCEFYSAPKEKNLGVCDVDFTSREVPVVGRPRWCPLRSVDATLIAEDVVRSIDEEIYEDLFDMHNDTHVMSSTLETTINTIVKVVEETLK